MLGIIPFEYEASHVDCVRGRIWKDRAMICAIQRIIEMDSK